MPIEKEEIVIPMLSLQYAMPKDIPAKLEKSMNEINAYNWKEMNLEEITEKFTDCLAKIWRVHPFRDGNTRTTLAFANIFAKQHGFERLEYNAWTYRAENLTKNRKNTKI